MSQRVDHAAKVSPDGSSTFYTPGGCAKAQARGFYGTPTRDV